MKILNKAKLIVFVTVLLLFSTALVAYSSQSTKGTKEKFASNLIKIKLKPQVAMRCNLPVGLYAESSTFGINELDQLLRVKGGTSVIRAHRKVKDQAWADKTGWDNWFLIRLDGRSGVDEAIASFKQNRYVEEAIPEYFAYTTAVPNDTYYPNHWGHNNTAQLPAFTASGHTGAGVGTTGFDSDAQIAWDLPQGYGNSNIIIAIIDSGVDTAHEDLRLVQGYDYGSNDSNPMDDARDAGHGTCCSGIAAAKANNNLGTTGIAGGCSVMPLKVADDVGNMSFTSIENAITHAADNGAHIISMSLGASAVPSQAPDTEAALLYARNKGLIIFAATANADDDTIDYPANSQYVISVGAASPSGERKSATSSDGEYWWGSNYGVNTPDPHDTVDIMAPTILPATDITGSGGYQGGNYDLYFNGTSCATPYAAGVAALVLSADSTLTPTELRTILTSTATDMTIDGGVGWDRYTGYGMVNAYNALMALDPSMPSVSITNPASFSTIDMGATVNVTATATDSDGYITSVAFYLNDVLQYTDSTSPYVWSWDTSSFSAGNYSIKAIATDNDSNTAQSSITVNILVPADEGFETGNFSAQNWTNNSSSPWIVQSTEKYSGTYAAKSGVISDNQQTEISISQVVSEAGNISFYYKVSSESSYDKLFFLVDGVEQANWSGEVNWTQASYSVTSGLRTFTWRYTKDVSQSVGSDCAWIDHIVFPPQGAYYAPATNFSAIPADGSITLNWTSPGGDVQNFKVYRDDVLLTTTPNSTYTDYAVSNGNSYTYYVVAVYAGGESDPTDSIEVTAGLAFEAILGTGTSATNSSAASPINAWYKSLHGQSIYTAAELATAGIVGPISITTLGFDVASVPIYDLPNFIVRIKHTTDTNGEYWQTATNMQTVYGPVTYSPSVGWDMLTLSTPFVWNGVDNIVIDTAFGTLSDYDDTGTVKYTTVTNGYRYIRADGSNQTNVFSGGETSSSRPNLKLLFAPLAVDPEISVSTNSLDFGVIRVDDTSTSNFMITNSGGGTLEGTISTTGAFSVAQVGSKISQEADKKNSNRNQLNYSINQGSSTSYAVTFDPVSTGESMGTVTITHNAGGEDVEISLSGSAYEAQSIPFVEGFESVGNNWVIVNGTQTNGWHIGEVVSNTGLKSIYISSDNGVSNGYETSSASVSHFYTDVAFPESATNFFLRFNWLANGEGGYTDYDYLRVYMVDTSVFPEAGTLLSSGSLTEDPFLLQTSWQNADIELPTGIAGSTKRLVFTWRNDSSSGAQPPAVIDEIRIVSIANQEIVEIIDGEAEVDLPPVTDINNNTITPSIIIDGVGGTELNIEVGYGSSVSPYSNAGLDIALSAESFSGAYILIDHNLGFIPPTIAFNTGSGWNLLYATASWTDTSVDFSIAEAKQKSGELIIVFSSSQDNTLPVTLSSFNAICLDNGRVKLNWVTATETGVLGYYILRSETDDIAQAQPISPLIEATNTSEERHYIYIDAETLPSSSYYYWLMSRDYNSEENFYGPLNIKTDNYGDNPVPEIPELTQSLGNFPNPFNPITNIRYSLAEPSNVKIVIYNTRGQMVRRLSRDHNEAGYYSLTFDGRDESGNELSSGLYFYRFDAGKVKSAHRMMLMK